MENKQRPLSLLDQVIKSDLDKIAELYPDGVSEIYTISEHDFRRFFLGAFSGNEPDPDAVIKASRAWMAFTNGTGVAKIVNTKGVEIARTPESIFYQMLQSPENHGRHLEERYENLRRIGAVNPVVALAQYHMITTTFIDTARMTPEIVQSYIRQWYNVIKVFLPEDKIKLNFILNEVPADSGIKADGDADYIEPDLC